MESELLNEIEAFLELHSMSPSRFGLMAVRDKNFVSDLRGGKRQLLLGTAQRVRDFMTAQPALPSPLSEAA